MPSPTLNELKFAHTYEEARQLAIARWREALDRAGGPEDIHPFNALHGPADEETISCAFGEVSEELYAALDDAEIESREKVEKIQASIRRKRLDPADTQKTMNGKVIVHSFA